MSEKKLRLRQDKEGKRINGKKMLAANITHAEAQKLSNAGFKAWFIEVDAKVHPCESERPAEVKTMQRVPSTSKPEAEGIKEAPKTKKSDSDEQPQ